MLQTLEVNLIKGSRLWGLYSLRVSLHSVHWKPFKSKQLPIWLLSTSLVQQKQPCKSSPSSLESNMSIYQYINNMLIENIFGVLEISTASFTNKYSWSGYFSLNNTSDSNILLHTQYHKVYVQKQKLYLHTWYEWLTMVSYISIQFPKK